MAVQVESTTTTDAGTRGFGRRHLQIFLLFLGISMAYALRINLSVGIVAMTKEGEDEYGYARYDWGQDTRGFVLSSFFWGYVVTQVPAGMLAQRYGPRLFLLVAIAGCSALAAATPLAAAWGGWKLLCALRVGQGLLQGMVFPCTHTMLGRWVPPVERARASAIVYGGTSFGTVTTMLAAGQLAESPLGWPAGFYLPALIGFVWAVIWFFFAADSPATCGSISKEERFYIESGLGTSSSGEKKLSTPWKSILTSLPMWSLIVVHLGQNFGHWILLTQMPNYMDSVLGFGIQENSGFSALPYFSLWICTFIAGWLAQIVNEREIVGVAASRKIWNTIGHWGAGTALLVLALTDVTKTTAVILLTVAVSLESCTLVGFFVNHVDLSPNFGGAMMGVTNGVSNLSGIVAPLAVGLIVKQDDEQKVDHEELVYKWSIVFGLAAGVYYAGNLFFVLAGKADVQPWNNPPQDKNNQVEAPSETSVLA